MAVPIEIFFGLGAALFWGLTDILIKKAVGKNNPLTAVKITLFVTVASILAYSLFFEKAPVFNASSVFFAVLAGIA